MYVTFTGAFQKTVVSLSLTAILLSAFTNVAYSEGPGLAERRAIKEYQDTKFPELDKQIDAAAGFDVKVTPHWDKLTIHGESAQYLEDTYYTDIFFLPLIDALKEIGKDQMGKEALKKGLKEVVLTYEAETAPISNYESGWTFENGVLTINYKPGVNSDGRDGSNFKERKEALIKILESKL